MPERIAPFRVGAPVLVTVTHPRLTLVTLIAALPRGLAEEIGERGVALSAGEGMEQGARHAWGRVRGRRPGRCVQPLEAPAASCGSGARVSSPDAPAPRGTIPFSSQA
jgi:hypothetical protein